MAKVGEGKSASATREEREDASTRSEAGDKIAYLRMTTDEKTPERVPSKSYASRYKTCLCRHFVNGFCKLGGSCRFAHGQAEVLRNAPPSTEIRTPPILPDVHCRYRLCRHFTRTGMCRLGSACKFAHGTNELLAWQSSR